MISFTGPAFILRSRDVGDTDRLYTLLTRDRGKIDAVAKGVRKQESKLQSSAQQLYELEVYIIAQRRFTLGGCVVVESFPELHRDLERRWAGFHMLELVDRMTRHEHVDHELYEFLRNAFATIEKLGNISSERIRYLISGFDLHVLSHLGVGPRLLAGPAEDDEQLFSLRHDGLYAVNARTHLPQKRISRETRSLLRFAQHATLEELAMVALLPEQASEVAHCVRIFYEDNDGHQLNTDACLADLGSLNGQKEI